MSELDDYNASKEQARLFQKQARGEILADEWVQALTNKKLALLLREMAIDNSTMYQTFNGLNIRMNKRLKDEGERRVQLEVEKARNEDPNWGAFT